MIDIEEKLAYWKTSLCDEIELARLFARSEIAHKWQATYRASVTRELIMWRLYDLVSQSFILQRSANILGARILLRSAFETLSSLIYMNNKMHSVVTGGCKFEDFCEITSRMMLGSKIGSPKHDSVNVLTTLRNSDKKYSGLFEVYENLSESAHPSFDGLCMGYSSVDEANYTTNFSNRWNELFGSRYPAMVNTCMSVFEHEYNEVWPSNFEALEQWLVENDAKLEAERGGI